MNPQGSLNALIKAAAAAAAARAYIGAMCDPSLNSGF